MDNSGNLLSKPGLGLAYDDWNRLRSATAQGTTTTYGVNGLGERTQKTQGSVQRVYVYAGPGQLLGVYDGATGQALEEWAYLGARPVADRRGSALYAIETDHLSAPLRVLDSGNAVVWSWENRDPFGANAPTEGTAGGQAFLMDLRLPGQVFDAESGLASNGFRDYDASLGRYVEVDPLGLFAGFSPYLYSSANPVLFTDPRGLAQEGYRPLDALRFIKTSISLNPVDQQNNLVMAHASMIFQDNASPTIVGFYKSKTDSSGVILLDDPGHSPSEYTLVGPIYDDQIMRKAYEKVSQAWNGSPYSLFSRNCQDFVSAMKAEYFKLGGTIHNPGENQ